MRSGHVPLGHDYAGPVLGYAIPRERHEKSYP